MTTNQTQTPADPSAYRVLMVRDSAGVVRMIRIVERDAHDDMGEAIYDAIDEVGDLIALARDEERGEPSAMPSDRAIVCAVLRRLGIPILGEQDDIDAAAMERALCPAQLPETAKAPPAATEPIIIGITLEGGLVQGVWSERAGDLPPLQIMVIDYDTDGTSDDEVTTADAQPGEDAWRVPRAIVADHGEVEIADPSDDGPRLIRARETRG